MNQAVRGTQKNDWLERLILSTGLDTPREVVASAPIAARDSPAVEHAAASSVSMSTQPPGERTRRSFLVAVAVVAVALITIVAVLVTVFVLHGGSGASGYPGEALSYFAARTLSDKAAAGVPGGPWSPFAATAYDVSTAASMGLVALTVWYSPGPPIIRYLTSSRPQIPAFGEPLSSGLSPWWLFEYNNGTTINGTIGHNETVVLGVVVVNGTAIPLAIFSTLLDLGVPASIPQAGLVDTSTVMAAAVASNTSFIDSHPGLNASFWLKYQRGPSPTGGWSWFVQFTTCAPFEQIYQNNSTSYTGYSYGTLAVNATTGVEWGFGFPLTEMCSTLG